MRRRCEASKVSDGKSKNQFSFVGRIQAPVCRWLGQAWFPVGTAQHSKARIAGALARLTKCTTRTDWFTRTTLHPCATVSFLSHQAMPLSLKIPWVGTDCLSGDHLVPRMACGLPVTARDDAGAAWHDATVAIRGVTLRPIRRRGKSLFTSGRFLARAALLNAEGSGGKRAFQPARHHHKLTHALQARANWRDAQMPRLCPYNTSANSARGIHAPGSEPFAQAKEKIRSKTRWKKFSGKLMQGIGLGDKHAQPLRGRYALAGLFPAAFSHALVDGHCIIG